MGTLLALGSCITIPVIGESNQNSFVFGSVVHIKNSISPRPQNAFQLLSYEGGQSKWRTRFALNTSGPSNNSGSQDNPSEENTGVGRTRLGIIVRAAGKQLLDKLNSARKNFPVKIFLLLLGFYTANALATILGQTGDWDVLVAGIVVAAIEGIGMLMYKKKASKPVGKFQSFILMVNYWKAGVCLGLFVDAFKLGS